jgi:hypothetical protein
MSQPWSSADDSQGHDFVEVRLCYQFTTLFNLDIQLPFGFGLDLGTLHLQQQAVFNVANY